VCTVSGSTVTYPVPGSCVIDANQAGNAAYSAAQQVRQTITITPNCSQTCDGVSSGGPQQSQSISFTAPGSGYVGDSVTLSATASSGLPVVFSVDPASGPGVCSVSGGTVTYAAPGSCVIDADQAGDAAYAAAQQVQQTISVQ
ncbi:MAG TPA: hypothetical protein VGS06_37365, partial [Streptosporangiaceae bacterium]|nr:hypothetical protein [Streptosporangiaceae bacterium]